MGIIREVDEGRQEKGHLMHKNSRGPRK